MKYILYDTQTNKAVTKPTEMSKLKMTNTNLKDNPRYELREAK